MSLTSRLSLYFLAATGLILFGFSTALYLLADQHLTRQLDDRLGAAARTLASAAEVDSDGIEWEPKSRPHSLAPGAFGDQLYWTVKTDDGRVIEQSAQPQVEDLMAGAEAAFRSGHRNPRRFDFAGRAWQVQRLRLEPDSSPLSHVPPGKHSALNLTVAVPLDPVHGTLGALAATLTGLCIGLMAIAILLSRFVCRRALTPVGAMAEAARSMGSADLSGRLPAPNSADELADLSTAFNGLLDRLEKSFERERRFAAEASHQLRTPLTALIGQVEVALRRDREPDEYRRVLGAVLAQGDRLRRVADALLFLARSEENAESPNRIRVNLVGWLPDRLTTWDVHARTRDLQFDPNGHCELAIETHPDLLGELLDALIDNAFKYSAPHSSVTVRIGREPNGVWVEVADQGCGIAESDLPHLFRPFFRSEEARQRGVSGVGLGLAVASRIASVLDGQIQVESVPGRGTRMRLRLRAGTRMPDDAGTPQTSR